jgi:hypothetical protein
VDSKASYTLIKMRSHVLLELKIKEVESFEVHIKKATSLTQSVPR